MLRDPREIERDAENKRDEIQRILNLTDRQMAADKRRDEVMRLTGEITAMEAQARELREHELETLRASVGGTLSADTDEGLRSFRAALLGFTPMNSLSTGSDGAALIPGALLAEVMDKARKSDPIFAGARFFDISGGSPQLRLPIKTAHGTTARAAESDTRPATTPPTFGEVDLDTVDRYGRYDATRRWVDSTKDAERLVIDAVTGDLFDGLSVDLATGDGSSKPLGLFANTTGARAYPIKLAASAGAIDAMQLLAAYTTLPPKFRPGAQWLMNGATLASLASLSYPNLNDTPLVTWQGGQAFMFGVPVGECTGAPNVGAGTYPVALANLDSAYAVASHLKPAVRIAVDNLTSPELTKVYGVIRMDGRPWSNEAAVLCKAATS